MTPDTSAAALVRHWTWAASERRINPATAAALATACRKVLEVQADWQDLPAPSLDVDKSVLLFQASRSGDLKPNSLHDYEQKFRRAVSAFLDYLKEPTTWEYPSRQPTHRQLPTSNGNTKGQVSRSDGDVDDNDSHGNRGQEYRYPFRPDFMAKLVIPRDATVGEITRLVAWAKTLAVDYQPEQ